MNRRCFPLVAASLMALSSQAQQIDFNIASRKAAEVTALNFTPVGVKQGNTYQFALGGLEITLDTPVKDQIIKSNWFKQGIQLGDRLTSDGIVVYPSKGDNAQLRITIRGLKPGHHSLLAYHNIVDGLTGNIPSIQVSREKEQITTVKKGKKRIQQKSMMQEILAQDIKQTVREMKASQSGQSYIEFDVTDDQPVVIHYQLQGVDNASNTLTINGLVFDKANPKATALNPYPADDDLHVNAEGGKVVLRWQAGEGAKQHLIYIGQRADQLKKVATTEEAAFEVTGLSSANDYYWRVDEVDANGKVSEGEVWNFRPRRLAFPGAEGYGRFAIGGRGGSVYHVTSLEDNPENPQPGSLRYGITKVKGPRTIVFDVAGIIDLKDRLVCSDPFITVAGQTAPGKGILLREHPFGFGSEGIFRFIRLRLGKYLDKNGKTITLDGLGAAGCDNTIIDHCSVGWTIDEAFSSRNGKNISFQHNLISEALNQAGHQNYVNAKHGYAATIGGNVGSFHHNLLANNEGRNWSMGGGLDGAGYYAGKLDLFNNVVYNWGNRACDGGAHEVNFVGNYYKMGPATSMKYILNAQLEGTGQGSQAYYMHDNIRQNYVGDMKQNAGAVAGKHGELVSDKEGETYKYTTSHGQVVNWKVFTDKPFFPSYAKVESARAAFKNVLSDVGANQPCIDQHDQRMVEETLNGTYKYVGSKTGKKGLIDDNLDAGNDAWKEFEALTDRRPANWDTDQDGMPDWWEKLAGTNPSAADNNELTDGEYTQLERYLNWLAEPHFITSAGNKLTIDLKQYFAGYNQQPVFTLENSIQPQEGKMKLNKKGILTISLNKKAADCLIDIKVKATDKDQVASLQRTFHIAITRNTDQDGMPDWWEEVKGVSDGNADENADGYTNNPQFECEAKGDAMSKMSHDTGANEGEYIFTANEDCGKALVDYTVKVSDDDNISTYTRTFHFYLTDGSATGIQNIQTSTAADSYEVYNAAGIKVRKGKNLDSLPSGVYIIKALKDGKVISSKKTCIQ